MVKLCEKVGCENEINEKYSFCYEHFSAGRKTDLQARSPGMWHDDPVVDALLKINANLQTMTKLLSRVTDVIEGNTALLPPKPSLHSQEPKREAYLKRTKESYLEDDELE